MENPSNVFNYLFGVTIVSKDDVLYIEDRRPTMKMGLAVGGLTAVMLIAGWSWFTNGLIIDPFTITFTAAAFVAALFFILTSNFRETYIFNKKTDTYTFTRQSALKKDVLEGSASEFRAVQVQKRIRDDRDIGDLAGDILRPNQPDSRSGLAVYSVALLNGGMLFGQSDTQILRKDPPFLSIRRTERRIAKAIASFLNIPAEGVVEVGVG